MIIFTRNYTLILNIQMTEILRENDLQFIDDPKEDFSANLRGS